MIMKREQEKFPGFRCHPSMISYKSSGSLFSHFWKFIYNNLSSTKMAATLAACLRTLDQSRNGTVSVKSKLSRVSVS